MVKRILLSLLIVISAFSFTNAQSLNERLQKLTGKASELYIGPAFDAFGMSFNGGWLNKPVKPVKSELTIEFGFVAMGAGFNKDESSFSLNSSFRFDKSQAEKLTESVTNPSLRSQVITQILAKDFNVTMYGPTVTGPSDQNIQIGFSGETFSVRDPKYPFPVEVELPSQLVDLGISGLLSGFPYLPTAAPQLKVGTIYGTRAIVRFLPGISMPNDFGKLNFFGFGMEHNPNVWFDGQLPVDLSVGFLTQSISVENLLSIKTLSYGLNVARTFDFGLICLTPYAGYMMEKSTVDVTYNQTIETAAGKENVNVQFNLEAKNKNRFLVGLNLQLSLVNLNFDYNMGNNKSVTTGLSFSF